MSRNTANKTVVTSAILIVLTIFPCPIILDVYFYGNIKRAFTPHKNYKKYFLMVFSRNGRSTRRRNQVSLAYYIVSFEEITNGFTMIFNF